MKILENIAALIKVKTIVTMVVIAVFADLALSGAISADNVMIIISMVVSFYFGTQHEKTATPTVSIPQPPAEVIDTVPDDHVLTAGSAMDAATYSANHPDPAV